MVQFLKIAFYNNLDQKPLLIAAVLVWKLNNAVLLCVVSYTRQSVLCITVTDLLERLRQKFNISYSTLRQHFLQGSLNDRNKSDQLLLNT